jgi:hypothetical protein
MPNESFTFDYNDKHGVELEFRPRRKDNSIYLSPNIMRIMQEEKKLVLEQQKDLQIPKEQIRSIREEFAEY